jgi:hypothetical protein
LGHRVLDAMVASAVTALAGRTAAMDAAEASRAEEAVARMAGLRPSQRTLVEERLLPALRRAANANVGGASAYA